MLCIDGGHARFCYCHRADFVFFFLLFLLCAHVLALYEKVSFFFSSTRACIFLPLVYSDDDDGDVRCPLLPSSPPAKAVFISSPCVHVSIEMFLPARCEGRLLVS